MLIILLGDLRRWGAVDDFICGDIFLSWEIFSQEILTTGSIINQNITTVCVL